MVKVIRIQNSEERATWNKYVRSRLNSTYAELTTWSDVLTRVYSLEERLYLAIEDEKPCGYLQLFRTKSVLTGRHAISAPLCSSGGGFHADSDDAKCALLETCERLEGIHGSGYVHLRLLESLEAPGWVPVVDRYVTFYLDLSTGLDGVWKQVLRAKARNQIRKGTSHGFEVVRGHHCLEAFVQVLHQGVKELGSPAPGVRFFEEVLTCYGNDVDLIVIKDAGKPIAGTILFYHGETVANPWAVTLRSYHRQCVNQALYWEIVKSGCARGMKKIDMGRSRIGSGTYDFKRRFGGQEHQLFYYYLARNKEDIPLLEPGVGKFAFVSTVWRNLPDWLTKRIGPRLMRELI